MENYHFYVTKYNIHEALIISIGIEWKVYYSVENYVFARQYVIVVSRAYLWVKLSFVDICWAQYHLCVGKV